MFIFLEIVGIYNILHNLSGIEARPLNQGILINFLLGKHGGRQHSLSLKTSSSGFNIPDQIYFPRRTDDIVKSNAASDINKDGFRHKAKI